MSLKVPLGRSKTQLLRKINRQAIREAAATRMIDRNPNLTWRNSTFQMILRWTKREVTKMRMMITTKRTEKSKNNWKSKLKSSIHPIRQRQGLRRKPRLITKLLLTTRMMTWRTWMMKIWKCMSNSLPTITSSSNNLQWGKMLHPQAWLKTLTMAQKKTILITTTLIPRFLRSLSRWVSIQDKWSSNWSSYKSKATEMRMESPTTVRVRSTPASSSSRRSPSVLPISSSTIVLKSLFMTLSLRTMARLIQPLCSRTLKCKIKWRT